MVAHFLVSNRTNGKKQSKRIILHKNLFLLLSSQQQTLKECQCSALFLEIYPKTIVTLTMTTSAEIFSL